MRDELEEEIDPVSEEAAVDCFEEDTEDHLADSDDDGDLHFIGVEELEFVGGDVPFWVHAEEIDTIRINFIQL